MAPGSGRCVSYVIPPPSSPVPRLKLPPLGSPRDGRIGPILLYAKDEEPAIFHEKAQRTHARHRLGVAALALDAATQLAGNAAPEGILYTGGRDGMLIAWDLGIPMSKRTTKYGLAPAGTSRRFGRWEMITGWADDAIDEEEDDEVPVSDGDILGTVTASGGKRRSLFLARQADIRYEDQWETDYDLFDPGKPARFRQHTQAHTDWVNDILLCNLNQTVVSCSSDGTIKGWNPNSSLAAYPTTIGTHLDYVRCLAYGRERNWIASGSFDRTIKLWDLSEVRNEPLMTLQPPESSGPKSSIYALAADPFGTVIASGSPERVVRTWDPRSGKRIGKLVGHTDNIRAILISEDSRYMLTGSADASIKLWSLASPQRCLHTFTYHTESVWSLFSSHPSLEVFYSGDRSGLVCKVDVEDCAEIADGECIVVCKDSGEPGMAGSEGVNKLISMDDNLLWTASGSSSVKRWRAPTRRAVRATAGIDADSPESSYSTASPLQKAFLEIEVPRIPRPHITNESSGPRPARHSFSPSISGSITSIGSSAPRDLGPDSTLFGIPFASLVRLASSNDGFPSFAAASRGRDPEVATLYSAASVMSVPRQNTARSPIHTSFPHTSPYGTSSQQNDRLLLPDAYPLRTHSARADFEERDVAADAEPLRSAPDEVIVGDHGLVRAMMLNDRIHAATVDTAGEVAVWDIVRAQCLGVFSREDVARASHGGSSSVDSAADNDLSPRQALETVRERIEGEAVVLTWAQADTKIGELTIHLLDRCFEAEIFADEAGYGAERPYSDEYRLNLGKWVLRNLFLGFIREEQRAALRSNDDANTHSLPQRALLRGAAHTSTLPPPRASSESAAGHRNLSIPLPSPVLAPVNGVDVPGVRSANGSQLTHIQTSLQESGLSPIPQSPIPPLGSHDATPIPRHQRAQTTDGSQNHPPIANTDYFTQRRRPSVSSGGPPTPDDFSGWGGPGSAKPLDNGPQTPSTPTGGFMGRLKNFGKISRRQTNDAEIPLATGLLTSEPSDIDGNEAGSTVSPPKTFVQRLKSQPLNPPSSTDAPHLPIPLHVSIFISEDSPSGWMISYRGTVGSTGTDVAALEEAMPQWLLEYLLLNKVSPVPITKISFVLLPVPMKGDQDEQEQLPELLNSAQSKLSASRFLRVRKLTYHVQEKMDKILPSTTPRSSTDDYTHTPSTSPTKSHESGSNRPRAEDVYEILCNDYVLPLDMTLAAVRQFIWRQAGELTMYYRRKRPLAPVIEQSTGSSGRHRT